MARDLTPSQRELEQYMSDLSEEAYCAGWMRDLEYVLWEALLELRSSYGRITLTQDHKTDLRRLSEACNGWIVYDDETGETWVSIVDWEKRFLVWRERRVPKSSDG